MAAMTSYEEERDREKAQNAEWRRVTGERLREARGEISLKEMGFRIWEQTGGARRYDASFLGRVERGEKPASVELLLAYRDVLGANLDTLPEAYLAEARRDLDERQVGLEGALANLRRFVAGAAAGLDLPTNLDPNAIRRALEAPIADGAGTRASAKAASPRSKPRSKKRAA